MVEKLENKLKHVVRLTLLWGVSKKKISQQIKKDGGHILINTSVR